MSNVEWWTKDGLGEWALNDLKKWKKLYADDIVWGKKSLESVIEFLQSNYSITEDDPRTAISETFYQFQLKEPNKDEEEPFRFFWITKDDRSKDFYDYYYDNELIWVVFGNKNYIYSASALFCCRLIQFQGLDKKEYDNNTENAFWYLENIDAMYRILNES